MTLLLHTFLKEEAMTKIWDVIAQLGLELHPDRVKSLAKLIHKLESGDDFKKIRKHLSPNINMQLIDLLEERWNDNKEISSAEISSSLLSASLTSELAASRSSVEMVWTGPSSGLVPIRHTEQVLKEVIESAKTSLFVVSFVAYDVPSIHKALNDAIERGVNVDILVESSQNSHSKIQVDSVPKMKESVPKANIYIWDQENMDNRSKGVVHAKCAIADNKDAFITSANLTTAAMERNVELGVLVTGGELPVRLAEHFNSLMKNKTLKLV